MKKSNKVVYNALAKTAGMNTRLLIEDKILPKFS